MFRLSTICVLIVSSVFLSSCDEEEQLVDVISGTKNLKWKKCDFYQTSIDAAINFNVTDSVNSGWYREEDDTAFFQFEVIDNQTIFLDSASQTSWSGTLKVIEYSSGKLQIEREFQSCSGEQFLFQ